MELASTARGIKKIMKLLNKKKKINSYICYNLSSDIIDMEIIQNSIFFFFNPQFS